MLAQLSVWPLDEPHMSRDIADMTQILQKFGVRFRVGPMGTTIEGAWDDVMGAIRACHQSMRDAHKRVLTTITIDDDATRSLNMDEATAKVTAHSAEPSA